MREWIEPALLSALGLPACVLTILLLRMRVRAARELAATRAESAALRRQLAEIERRLAAPVRPRPETEYRITALGEDEAEAVPAPTVEPALFADLVLRETVVRAASLAHGVRRALAPEVRNRIRFEVRREVRRARKQRRLDLREARRAWESRQRMAMTDDEDAA